MIDAWPPPIAYSFPQCLEQLSPGAQQKLGDLEGEAADAAALSRVLQDRIRKQESKCSEIAHRRDRAAATRNAAAVAELDAELQAAVAVLDKLRRDLDARNAVAANTTQTVSRLRNFIIALVGGLSDMQPPPPPPGRLPPLQRADESVLAAIDRLRREIAVSQAEISRIKSAPLPLAEIKAAIASQVDAMAAAGQPRVQVLGTTVEVAWPDLPPVPLPEPVYSPGSASRLACWLHRDRLLAELVADLPEDSPHAIASADRPGLLREIESRVYGLEISEEKLIMHARGQGLDGVQRRAAASCWAILFTEADDEQEAVREAAE